MATSNGIWQKTVRVVRVFFGFHAESKRLVGKDHHGNIYWEDSNASGTKKIRWFEPVEKNNFQAHVPVEWEAWLRKRRISPPDESEIARNMSIAEMTKRNAEELEEEERRNSAAVADPLDPNYSIKDEKRSFPKYQDYT